jgi:hypothetical protein
VGAEFSFNFLSEAERIRITESVERIKRMQAEDANRLDGVDRSSALLLSECDPHTTHATSVSPGENGANDPMGKSGVVGRLRPAYARSCRHGIFHHQCPTCNALGW